MANEEKLIEGEGGVRFKPAAAEYKAPEEALLKEEEGRPSPELEVAKAGKVPLHPAMVKIPLRAEGLILSEWTKWEGWLYTEAELNDIADLAIQVGIELNPAMQFFTALLGAHAFKMIGFVRWRRAGSPIEEKGREEGK